MPATAAHVPTATSVATAAGVAAPAPTMSATAVRSDERNVVARPIPMTRFRESGRSNEKSRCGSNRDMQP